MTLPNNERQILEHLRGHPRGQTDGLPILANQSREEVEDAATRLCDRKLINVSGPPNQNSPLGRDLDEVVITSWGLRALALEQ